MGGGIPFGRRIGPRGGAPVAADFPFPALISLSYILEDLVNLHYIARWDDILREIGRAGGIADPGTPDKQPRHQALRLLSQLTWDQRYEFCERAYGRLLQPVQRPKNPGDPHQGGLVDMVSLGDVRAHYEQEINDLLQQHGLGFRFEYGRFVRTSMHAQRNVERVDEVLQQPRMVQALSHYSQARKALDQYPRPDIDGSVRAAVGALREVVAAVTHEPEPADLVRAIRHHTGSGPGQIPANLAESLVHLLVYCTDLHKVAQSGTEEGREQLKLGAELVLSLLAGYIAYLAALFPET